MPPSRYVEVLVASPDLRKDGSCQVPVGDDADHVHAVAHECAGPVAPSVFRVAEDHGQVEMTPFRGIALDQEAT